MGVLVRQLRTDSALPRLAPVLESPLSSMLEDAAQNISLKFLFAFVHYFGGLAKAPLRLP